MSDAGRRVGVSGSALGQLDYAGTLVIVGTGFDPPRFNQNRSKSGPDRVARPSAASRRRVVSTSWPPWPVDSQKATMPSPPIAPGTTTEPMGVSDPPGPTWNSSTVPVAPVCT